MREISTRGYEHGEGRLSPQECAEVSEYVIERCLGIGRNLDLRVLINAFHDRLQDRAGHAETPWQEMVESRLRERVVVTGTGESRAARIAREQRIAQEIAAMPIPGAEKERLWSEKTTKSARAYYRRLAADCHN